MNYSETNQNKFSKSFQVIDDTLIIENCETDYQENTEKSNMDGRDRTKINFKRIISISFSFSNILKIQNLLGLSNLKVRINSLLDLNIY